LTPDIRLCSGECSPPSGQVARSNSEVAWSDLASFNNRCYHAGRCRIVRALWYLVSLLIFETSWVPFVRPKCWLLRLFGAKIGRGLVIKPNVRIKYPWRLSTGDHCWIGQGVWIDNLADVRLGDHVCVSQETYICTGSHDYHKRTFDLITLPVELGNGVWLGARTLILGNVSIGPNAVVAAGSIVTKAVAAAAIVAGVPARRIGKRMHLEDPASCPSRAMHLSEE
jgi:putative colanic acid biosynthesis acetyltransferase WcaF